MTKANLNLKVPASTANLGCGFDSIGMALNKFLYLKIELSSSSRWHFKHEGANLQNLPTDESHYIYQIAQSVAQKYQVKLPALNVQMYSEIPMARGLGSSASALVAGLYIANYFGDIELSKYELLQLATEFEGHPDNVAPTIYGGLVVGYHDYDNNQTDIAHIEVPDVDFINTVPRYELETEKSRSVLPETISHKDAVKYSAISNTMISALIQHNYELAGKMMEKDGLHEPYRQHLIRDFDDVKRIAHHHGAYATVLSGAGPTMMTMIKKENSGALVRALRKEIQQCHSELITINKVGVEISANHYF
ncbi:homoserine kinase [Staphylococcus felis]|uniref:homoserine kinase n=1 Tax=Staphylococcus felis TaxID=46127 RepID=UPI000E220DC6|nr:homoserine kinase [Staphylococcus felis]REI01377.1 homoserine kinase [Staphylococcus felis]REI10586.1 homoserine kinase [Staphylococcus felis]REI24646.1 homoserine kinase [Staphylococcus felis]